MHLTWTNVAKRSQNGLLEMNPEQVDAEAIFVAERIRSI